MILEFRLDEQGIQPAYLKTIYETIEELNCKCTTYIDDTYNRRERKYYKTRTIEVYGSDTMVSWLYLRMQRYVFQINQLKEGRSVLGMVNET